LIIAPNGKTLLIDGGRDGKGQEVILPYLKDHAIHSLDAILATHYDGDHIGGIDEVIAGEDGQLGTSDDLTPKIGIFDRGGTPLDNAPAYPGYVLAAGDLKTSQRVKIP
jgi:glyoxylase-like metal-dependent hydrolase (beta-lactamase superfamily II)